MKIRKGWIGKVVFSLLLTLSIFMTSFNDQMIAQSKKSPPTQITNPDKTIVLTKLDEKYGHIRHIMIGMVLPMTIMG